MGLTTNLGKLSNMITSTGSAVGIGTSSPSYTLDVTGTGRFTGNVGIGGASISYANYRYLTIVGGSTTQGGDLYLKTSDASYTAEMFVDNTGLTLSSSDKFTLLTGAGVQRLQIASTGAATFSSTILAGQGTFQSTGANIISKNTTTSQSNFIRYDNSVGGARAYLGYETAGTDFYIENGEGKLLLATNSGTAMTLSGLNVGIGTTSPNDYSIGSTAKVLQVTGSSYGIINANAGSVYAWLIADTGAAATGTQSNHDFKIVTNNTERMRITSGGNVGIGTSSPSSQLQVSTNSTSQSAAYIEQNANYNGLAVTSSGNSGTYYIANFRSTGVDRMRILDNGNVLVGTTTDTGQKLQVQGSIIMTGSFVTVLSRDISNNSAYGFANSGGGNFTLTNSGVANVGNFNMTNGIYTPVSDVNKKKDFEASEIGLNAILNLKPTLFRMKSEDENVDKTLGFIAQEVKEFIPQAYVESGEGDTKFIGLSDRPIIAALVKAVQELKTEIDELKNK